MSAPLLRVDGLSVTIPTTVGDVHALEAMDLEVSRGEVVGLVGESGGGKSMLARSVVSLLPPTARTEGRVLFDDVDVFAMDDAQLASHRGHGAAMCFQSPRGALDPLRSIAGQIGDRLQAHQGLHDDRARDEAARLLLSVGIEDTARCLSAFPHELSGGMCQRVMIAMCLACDPGLLLADEPTTGLDVGLTKEILALFRDLAVQQDRGVLLISHDIASVASVSDRVVVLERGRVVERGSVQAVVRQPQHPYTRALVDAVPDVDRVSVRSRPALEPPAPPALDIRDLHIRYRSRFSRGGHHAVRGVDLRVGQGETVGLVGESGSGKTSIARAVMRLQEPSSGTLAVAGQQLGRLRRGDRRRFGGQVQMVFQDPVGALDPRRDVLDAVTEPLLAQKVARAEREDRAREVLRRTGLDDTFLDRRPHELSGGQAQRVGIARALICDPDLLVFDEPTSALDVTVQAQILELIQEVTARREAGGQLFISHDLATVRGFCDSVVVLLLGQVVEEGPTEQVFSDPQHDYTKALLAAAPRLLGPEGSTP